MVEQQQLVQETGPGQLRRERRAAYADAALGAGSQGRELLDRVVPTEDPGVVIGAAAGAGGEHPPLGGPGLPRPTPPRPARPRPPGARARTPPALRSGPAPGP